MNTAADGQAADPPAPAGRRRRSARAPRGRDRAAPDRARHEDRDRLREARAEGAVRPAGRGGRRRARRQAKRLRAALEELGPTFAKLGQMLSTRPDLLPPEFIEELATLQDHVPPLTEEQVVGGDGAGARASRGRTCSSRSTRKPLAAGTIAQVHRATLATGEKRRREGAAARREGGDRAGPGAAGGVRREGRTPPGAQAGDRHGGGVRAPVGLAAPRAGLPAGGRQHAPHDGGDRAVLAPARAGGVRRSLHVAPPGDARRRGRSDRATPPRAPRARRRRASCSSRSTSRSWSTASSTPTRTPGT